jgi:hypothetical protein
METERSMVPDSNAEELVEDSGIQDEEGIEVPRVT